MTDTGKHTFSVYNSTVSPALTISLPTISVAHNCLRLKQFLSKLCMVMCLQSQPHGRQRHKDPLSLQAQGHRAYANQVSAQRWKLDGISKVDGAKRKHLLFSVNLITIYLAGYKKRRRGTFSGLNFQFIKCNTNGSTKGHWWHSFIHSFILLVFL